MNILSSISSPSNLSSNDNPLHDINLDNSLNYPIYYPSPTFKVSPNKKMLALLNNDESIELWSLEEGIIVKIIDVALKPLINFQFSSSSTLLSLEGKNYVEVYSLPNDKSIIIKENPNLSIRNVKFSPSSKHLLILLDFNLSLHVWNLDFSSLPSSSPPPPPSSPLMMILPSPSNGGGISIDNSSFFIYCSKEKGIDFINIYNSFDFSFIRRIAIPSPIRLTVTSSPKMFNNDSIFIFDDENSILFMISLLDESITVLVENVSNCFWGDDLAIITFNEKNNLFSLFNYSLLKVSNMYNLLDRRSSKIHYIEGDADYYVLLDDDDDDDMGFDVDNKMIGGSTFMYKVEFSFDNSYISLRSSLNSKNIWIFSLMDLSIIAVIHQKDLIFPHSTILWHPSKSILCFTDINCRILYMWQPNGCLLIKANGVRGGSPPTSPTAIHLKEWLKEDCLLISDSQNIMKVLPQNMSSF